MPFSVFQKLTGRKKPPPPPPSAVEPQPKGTSIMAARFSPTRPLYFLHVPKTMGTAIRYGLENGVAGKEILFPYQEQYYPHQLDLPGGAAALAEPKSCYFGHFGWDLPAALPGRPWTILTVLRDPKDRLLSLFDYCRQFDQLPATLTLEEWLESKVRCLDFMNCYFVPQLWKNPAAGTAAVAAVLENHLPAALENLRCCSVVGIQEEPQATLNLISHATGCLLPPAAQKVNASRRQHRLENISPEAASLLAGVTGAEEILFREGRRLFQQQAGRLLEELGLEPGTDGNDVAALLTAKTVAGFSRADPAQGIKWQPKQSYPGGNLHSREFHDNMALRWTGPATHTEFFFNLSPQESWKITIRLHPATPSTHAQAAALTVDGHAVALELESWPDGQPHTLTGRFPPSGHPAALRKFCLTSPVSKGNGEWRMLGLCLKGINFERETS
ncbi:MAG: hypothetical protein V4675_18000 [Verrucomicrobiota bacterium]